MANDHLRLNLSTHRLECQACGGEDMLWFPVLIDDLVERGKQFIQAHKGCVVKEEEAGE